MKDRLANSLWFLSGIILALAATGIGTVSAQEEEATLWDRAVSAVSDTAGKYTNDEAIANYVMASVAKQNRVNRILGQKGSTFRVSDLRVVLSVPPALHVGITDSGASSTPLSEPGPPQR